MDTRFRQAHKEARWAVALTVLYLICWIGTAYLPDRFQIGLTGLPVWFELSCMFLPIIFTLLCSFMVKFIFKDMPLTKNGN